MDEPGLHLGRHILVPDLAGWRRERMPTLPDEAYFTLSDLWMPTAEPAQEPDHSKP